jgi:hypothetical protein
MQHQFLQLQFLNSCRSFFARAIIFHGFSSSIIIYTYRRFRFASAVMEMKMVRQPASQPAIYTSHKEAHSLPVPISAPSNEITIFTQVHKR